MQDIHWTDGAFSYFPSYTLGAMHAAQFMASMKQSVDVDSAIQSGDLPPIFTWLSDNICNQGSLLTTDELVKLATGETLNATYFKEHLRRHYLNNAQAALMNLTFFCLIADVFQAMRL